MHPIRAPSLKRLSRRPQPDRGPTSDTLLATPLPPVTASGSRTPSPLVVALGIVDSFHQGPLGGVVALSMKVSDYVRVRGGKMECTFLYKPAQTLGTATEPNITKPQSISYLNSRMPTMKPVCIDPVSPYQCIVPLWGEHGKQGMRNGISKISTSP